MPTSRQVDPDHLPRALPSLKEDQSIGRGACKRRFPARAKARRGPPFRCSKSLQKYNKSTIDLH